MRSLKAVSRSLDGITEAIGNTAAWFASFMVFIQFFAVLFRFVFGVNLLFVQDIVLHLHALLFLLGAGFAVLLNGHVRVDIFYRDRTKRQQDLIDCAGLLLALFPFCLILLYFSVPYIVSSWSYLEGSRERSGVQLIFLLKSMLAVFSVLLLIQGVSELIRRLLSLLGDR